MDRMRRLSLLVVLALLAACSGSDDPTVPAGGPTTTSVATVDGAPDEPGEPGAPVEPVEPGEQPGITATRPPGGTDLSGTETTTGQAPTVAVPEVDGPPGSAAAFYLRPADGMGLVVEISAEPGAEPDPATVRHVANILIAASGKGVSVTEGGEVPSRESWTESDLRAAADGAARAAQSSTQGVIRLLFVHGDYAESDTVLGVAVRADTAAIFSDGVDRSRSPLVGSRAIETAVTTHEVGHLLGLVDLYLDTGRDDPEHPGHSTNRRSVMYWAVESTLVTDLLTGGPPRELDDADRADLAAIRAG